MRAGYAGRTLVYGVVAGFWLYAICWGGKAEGTPEALQQLETTTPGGVILFVTFAGLAFYAIWGFIDTIWDVGDYDCDAKRMVARGHDRDGSHSRRAWRPRLLAPLPRRPVQIVAVHPRPPLYGSQPTTMRDAHLLMAALEARDSDIPAIVAGDMNATSWERTVRRAMRIDGLLDPRVERGV